MSIFKVNPVKSYIDEADVQFLGCVSSLQVASDVHIVVPDYPSDDVRGGDALGPLGGSKHTYKQKGTRG